MMETPLPSPSWHRETTMHVKLKIVNKKVVQTLKIYSLIRVFILYHSYIGEVNEAFTKQE